MFLTYFYMPHNNALPLVMPYIDNLLVNNVSNNGLVPDGTKPLPEPMLTGDYWHPSHCTNLFSCYFFYFFTVPFFLLLFFLLLFFLLLFFLLLFFLLLFFLLPFFLLLFFLLLFFLLLFFLLLFFRYFFSCYFLSYNRRHQAITWTNVDLSSLRSSDVHLRAISLEISQPSVTKIILKLFF